MKNIIIVLLLICLLSCSSKNSLPELTNYYENNKEKLMLIFEQFKNDSNIFSIRRYELDNNDPFFPNKSRNFVTYDINSTSGSLIVISVDKKFKDNEVNFWKDSNYMVTSSNNILLTDYLDSANILLNTFVELRNFLSESDFFFISRLKDKNFILIMKNSIEGYIYNPDNEYPIFPQASELKKIDDHIYYFKFR